MADLIDREKAIDAISEYATIWMSYTEGMTKHEIAQEALNAAKDTMIRICKELPSAQPEQVMGKWIDTDNYYQRWKCSVCGCHTRDAKPPYCPYCGKKMREEQDG